VASKDIMARLIGQWLSERLGQQFLVENRSGAGGNIGRSGINSPPDGCTMLPAGSPNAINATLYDRLDFVFLRDIAPVASFARTPLVMEVHPSVPAKTIPEFIAYAKANPGKINYASAGIGLRRVAQDNDRHRHRARPLSRLGAGAGRYAGRAGPGDRPAAGLDGSLRFRRFDQRAPTDAYAIRISRPRLFTDDVNMPLL
jgi:hypothetical protein